MNTRFEWAKGQRAWRFLSWTLFAAALSLAFYLPYRYAVRPPTMPSLYAFLLPLSAILVIVGITLALRPAFAFRMPVMVRAGIAAVAVLWFAAGMVCIPALVTKIVAAPAIGFLATLQMFMQHLFLSTVVGTFVAKPDQACVWFGLSAAATRLGVTHAVVEAQANVRG